MLIHVGFSAHGRICSLGAMRTTGMIHLIFPSAFILRVLAGRPNIPMMHAKFIG